MSVLRKPLVTEKVSALNEKGKYGFIVDRNANKVEIKKAVEATYNVSVKSVNTISVLGKRKVRFTTAGVLAGRKPDYKKAIVTLVDGDVIDFYGNL